MPASTRASILFGLIGLLASLPIVWFFRGLFFESSAIMQIWWYCMPLIAFASSSGIAYILINSLKSQRFGPMQGAISACLALVVCALLTGLPSLNGGTVISFLLLALLWCGWFVAIMGALAGWACRFAIRK
jgi:hypothetical protein